MSTKSGKGVTSELLLKWTQVRIGLSKFQGTDNPQLCKLFKSRRKDAKHSNSHYKARITLIPKPVQGRTVGRNEGILTPDCSHSTDTTLILKPTPHWNPHLTEGIVYHWINRLKSYNVTSYSGIWQYNCYTKSRRK